MGYERTIRISNGSKKAGGLIIYIPKEFCEKKNIKAGEANLVETETGFEIRLKDQVDNSSGFSDSDVLL